LLGRVVDGRPLSKVDQGECGLGQRDRTMDLLALEQVYTIHRKKLFLCALSITRRRDLAEDAVHEAVARLCRTATRPDDMLRYTMRAVRNAAIDCLRRAEKEQTVGDRVDLFQIGAPGDGSGPVDPLLAEGIERALGQLKTAQRAAVILKIWGGLTFKEIASTLERPLNTVASDYRRGLEKIRTDGKLSHE
jgi:RNA polymerase sigma factor (sigma-70 family)